MLMLIGILGPAGETPQDAWFASVALGLSLALITGGLVASTFHLEHPERAWRAFSQWRSSWLSREGVSACATYPPAGAFGIIWIFFGTNNEIWIIFGVIAALGAAATVFCTSMIYRSLKTIDQWHNRYVVPVFLALALATGATCLNLVVRIFGAQGGWIDAIALVSLAVAGALKVQYWRFVDDNKGLSTPETATGLGTFGEVRLLDSPHTEDNYLMREMGFRIARKHGEKLRHLTLILGFVIPFCLIAFAVVGDGPLATISVLFAAISLGAGVLIERWLFFAEARHTVTLYYGYDGDGIP